MSDNGQVGYQSQPEKVHWFLRQRKHIHRVSKWGLLGDIFGCNDYDYSVDAGTGEVLESQYSYPKGATREQRQKLDDEHKARLGNIKAPYRG